ncbi:MAG TPA: luciferase family protein [Candidatus Binatia bacterium]|nr:luciferase family protein [Candidatus Binatia bacterium]
MKYFERFVRELSSWPDVTTHPHRFGGREFRFKAAEIALAEEHHWVPNSGWITFQVRGEEDLKHALWLMRLSYMRYALKIACDPRRFLDEQSEELQLSPHLKSLFEGFFPKSAAA